MSIINGAGRHFLQSPMYKGEYGPGLNRVWCFGLYKGLGFSSPFENSSAQYPEGTPSHLSCLFCVVLIFPWTYDLSFSLKVFAGERSVVSVRCVPWEMMVFLSAPVLKLVTVTSASQCVATLMASSTTMNVNFIKKSALLGV